MIGLSRAMTARAFEPRSLRVSVASRFRSRLMAAVLGFDQQLGSVAADVEPQEIEPLGQVHDPGLVLVDGKTPGLQPLGQPRLDLFGLLPGLAAHREIVGVSHQHRGARHRYPGLRAGFAISCAGGFLQPVECDVQ